MDLLGGITAGVVALPLALAFGEQSGLGAAAGLYGAAFLAFFAALFGGTPTQISGPTAPMTALSMVIVAGLLQAFEGKQEEALAVILMVFLLAGIFQIILGILRLGVFVKYIPRTVVSGFMTGIGVIILITQTLPALGYYSGTDEEVVKSFFPRAEELILERILEEEAEDGILVLEEFNETIDRANLITYEDILAEATVLAQNDSKGVIGSIKYLPRAIAHLSWLELLLTLVTIGIIYGFRKITKHIPSTLVALLLVAGLAFTLGFDYVRIQEIPKGYPAFHLDIFQRFDLHAFTPYIFSALMLAFLGSIDSLLTSLVADNMTRTQHKPNKELIGQGIGNSIAAFFGGIPGAGATIRTVVNIQSGGKTRLSGMISGLLLFAIIIYLGPVASEIPAAVLAGVLITVGIGVMDHRGLKGLPNMEFSEKAVLITVLVLTVFWQLVYAVALGLVMASIVFLKKMSDISARRIIIKNLHSSEEYEPRWRDEEMIRPEIRDKVFFKHLNGPIFFGMVNELRTVFKELGDIHILIIRMEKVPFIDQTGLYTLEEAIKELHDREVIVGFTGLSKKSEDLLRKMRMIPK
jgi:SulP family sulfate permease